MANLHKRFTVAVEIAALLSLLVFCNVVEADWVKLPQTELAALQDLLGAWNTTAVGSNLPGTVSDTSIDGILPNTVWNFSNIVSLTLTGNRGLRGAIPPVPKREYEGWTLKSLDLHGNAFDSPIPESLFVYYNYIEDIDLSNNRLEGALPASLGKNSKLRNLRLSNNSFSGSIPWNISENWTHLVTADFSRNTFTGSISNFTVAISLQTLNVSHNNLDGQVGLNVLSPLANTSLAILDLSDNKFTGLMPDLGLWNTLQSLNLSYNTFEEGPFPPWLSSLTSLQTLGLSNTSLTGELNLSMLCNFAELSTIELDNNNINGTLDIDNLRCSAISRQLRTVRLKYNQIDKVRFSSPNVSDLPITLELTGNPYCRSKTTDTDLQRCFCEQRCHDTYAETRTNRKIVIGAAIGGSLGVVMMIIAAILLWKNRRDGQYLLLTVNQKFAEYEMKPTLFAYGELEKATRNFHPDMKLGEGAFGAVYKGKLADGSEVAVKQLLTNAQQNMDEFLNEVVLLTSVKHRNLVKLKGCCFRGDQRLLVYEYLDNYDLAETLFEHKGNQLVTWPTRFNICLGVAQGLHYLHAGVEPRILHRDIKASNVLLDHNLHPKIADFGLAMLFPNEESHVTIVQIVGTKGYLAPEYATRGQLSDKVDVFSFGVLALEVVSGRKNISFDVPSDKTYLIEWAWKLNDEGRLLDLVDPTLSIQFDEEVVVQRVLATALACLRSAAEKRPTMAQVVGMLLGDIEIGESVRSFSINENVIQTYRALLGLNNTNTILTAVDEESQALHLGESSSSGSCGPRAFELSAIKVGIKGR